MTRFLTLAALLLLATACSERPQARPASEAATPGSTARITGTVTYHERVALSNQSRLEITLEDVSRQDVAADVIAQAVITDPGQVPIRFELEYPPDAIDPGRSYALRLRISEAGRLRFINDTHIPVLTRGAGREVRATLIQVGGWQPQVRTTSPEAGGGMVLRGMFRYMADAAVFRDCRTDRSFPVAMEGAYLEVERAYLNSGITNGEPVLIEVVGRYLERPSMEENRNEVSLIIDIFNNLLPDETCSPDPMAELAGTYWRLDEVGGNAVHTSEGQREAHFALDAAESRVRGHGGCNNFFGGYWAGDGTLAFSGLGSTMMACEDGMETEQAFLDALGRTTRYRIGGLFLTLYDDQEVLARFEAMYFR